MTSRSVMTSPITSTGRFPLTFQADGFYNKSPQNRERSRNIGANCKTRFASHSCLHFVRFESQHDQRFQNAVRVFGPPDFLHRHWDRRALREIAASDVIVFAKSEADQPFVTFNGDDEAYVRAAASPNPRW